MKEKDAMRIITESEVRESAIHCANVELYWKRQFQIWRHVVREKVKREDFSEETSYCKKVMYEAYKYYLEKMLNHLNVVKLNKAYFQEYNSEELFWDVARYAKRLGYFVIGDLNFGCKGPISKRYAEAYLSEKSPFDAITINPYFGTDGVKAFLDFAKKNRKYVFVEVKTSFSSEIQDALMADGRHIYELVAGLVKEWGEYTNLDSAKMYNQVGAIFEGLNIEQIRHFRELMPKTLFLLPVDYGYLDSYDKYEESLLSDHNGIYYDTNIFNTIPGTIIAF